MRYFYFLKFKIFMGRGHGPLTGPHPLLSLNSPPLDNTPGFTTAAVSRTILRYVLVLPLSSFS